MVEFKCGKMKKADGETRVTPDLRKGKLTVKSDQDQLIHVIWTNREQGIFLFSWRAHVAIRALACSLTQLSSHLGRHRRR